MMPLLERAVRFEADGWYSLARWATRRPDVGPGRAFAYRGPMVPLVLVFTAVSALEVVAVDVIVPWPAALLWLRIVVLALGVWGVLVGLGVLAGITVHPHVVGPEGVRLRSGRGVDVRLPREAIGRVRRVRRTRDGKAVQLDGGMLHLPVGSQTTIEITLRTPVEVTLRGHGTVPVAGVALHADDAAGFVAALRE